MGTVYAVILKLIDNRLINDTLPGDLIRKLRQWAALTLGVLHGIEVAYDAHCRKKRDKDHKRQGYDYIFKIIFHIYLPSETEIEEGTERAVNKIRGNDYQHC